MIDDMNPVATAGGLTLNVSETDNVQDLALARDVAKLFRLTPKRANEIVADVVKAVRGWRVEAKKLGLARSAQDRMAAAFQETGGIAALTVEVGWMAAQGSLHRSAGPP